MADLSQADIAKTTGLSLPTIKRAESERDVAISGNAIDAIRHALESAGVIFVAENGEGPGVREIFEAGVHLECVPRGNAAALAETLARLIRNAEAREALGLRGRARAFEVATADRVGETLRAALVERMAA